MKNYLLKIGILFGRIILFLVVAFELSVVQLDKDFLLYDLQYVGPAVCLCASLLTFGIAIIVQIIQNIRKRAVDIYPSLYNIIRFLTLYIFLLVVFAPANFGTLNGSEWEREFTRIEYLYDWVRLLIAFGVTLMLYRFIRINRLRIELYILIVLVGISVFCINSNTISAAKVGAVVQSIDDWHILGSSKNIIVIIADGMQGSLADSVLSENPQLQAIFADFKLYSRALSPHVFTSYGVPAILQGSTDHWTKNTVTQEILDIAKQDNFVKDARSMGYQTQEFMTSNRLTFGSERQYNVLYYTYVQKVQLYTKIALSRMLPISWLRAMYRSGSDDSIFANKKNNSLRLLHTLAEGMDVSTRSASLTLHHSMLSHPPLLFGRDGSYLPQPISGTYKEIKDETYFMLSAFGGMLDKIKKLGKWDSSLIIIVGDHGAHFEPKEDTYDSVHGLSYYTLGAYNPVLLIKRPYEAHPFEVDTANIATVDVRGLVDQYLTLPNWQTLFTFPISKAQSVWATATPQKGKYEQYYSLKDFQKISNITSIDDLSKKFFYALNPSLSEYREAHPNMYMPITQTTAQGLLGPSYVGKNGVWLTDKPAWQFVQLDKNFKGNVQILFDMTSEGLAGPAPTQSLDVFVNNVHVGALIVSERKKYLIDVPASLIDYKSRKIKIEIVPLNFSSPQDIKNWEKDTRLSVWIYGYIFRQDNQ